MKSIVAGALLLSSLGASATPGPFIKIDCSRPSVKDFGFTVEIEDVPRLAHSQIDVFGKGYSAKGKYELYEIKNGAKKVYKSVELGKGYQRIPKLNSKAWYDEKGNLHVIAHDTNGDSEIPLVKFSMVAKSTKVTLKKLRWAVQIGEIYEKGYMGKGSFTYEPKGSPYGKGGKLWIYSCTYERRARD